MDCAEALAHPWVSGYNGLDFAYSVLALADSLDTYTKLTPLQKLIVPYCKIHNRTLQQQFDVTFEAMDDDKNGVIDFQEFQQLMMDVSVSDSVMDGLVKFPLVSKIFYIIM